MFFLAGTQTLTIAQENKWTSLYRAFFKKKPNSCKTKQKAPNYPRLQYSIKLVQREEASMETMCGLVFRTFLLDYPLSIYLALNHLLISPKYGFHKLNSLKNCPFKSFRNISLCRWQRGPFNLVKCILLSLYNKERKTKNRLSLIEPHSFGSSD